jgi:hypothetical protein
MSSTQQNAGLLARALRRVATVAKAILNLPRAIWAKEPTTVVSVLSAAIIFGGAHWGIVLDKQSVAQALLIVLPIVLGGQVVRATVWSPATITALLTKLGASDDLAGHVAAAIQAAQPGVKR